MNPQDAGGAFDDLCSGCLFAGHSDVVAGVLAGREELVGKVLFSWLFIAYIRHQSDRA